MGVVEPVAGEHKSSIGHVAVLSHKKEVTTALVPLMNLRLATAKFVLVMYYYHHKPMPFKWNNIK